VTERFLEILAVMPAAFVMCLVLTGIHGYLGLHVLERKVIFVDLALAQIAALGGIVAMGLGYDLHEELPGHAPHRMLLFEWLGWNVTGPPDAVMIYLFSLLFALGGAAVFALTRMKQERVPQEAFIGISFATAVALAILVLAHRGGGAEHVRNMLANDALMIATWKDVGTTAVLYSVIGLVHVAFRRQFFRISLDPESAAAEGMRIHGWDFLFYATFGFVITSSVSIAGVLLVFSYLVVPGAIAVMFAERVSSRILLAWGVGFFASVLGMLVCAWDNLEPPGSPPGPWIVACFSATLILAGLTRKWWLAPDRKRSARNLAGGTVLTAALLGVALLAKKEEVHRHDGDPILGALDGGLAERLRAIDRILETRDTHYVPSLCQLLLADPEEAVVEHAVKVLADFSDPTSLPALLHTARRDLDPGLRTEVARAVVSLREPVAIEILLDVLDREAPPFLAQEAEALLREVTGRDVVAGDPTTTDPVREWYEGHRDRLRWNAVRGAFEAGE